jgi:predicted phosphodiesterase
MQERWEDISMHDHQTDYQGLLLIGDPHLEGRQPGFRKDDYPQVILEKFRWCLLYARQHRLLPALLGDIFDKPRDNPTWMINQLIEMLDGIECLGIYGNHDCANPQLCEHDSLSILFTAKRVRLLTPEDPWQGQMNGRTVVVGGCSYRIDIPQVFYTPSGADKPLVIWLTHHDVKVPGYEEQGRFNPRQIEGIDIVVNGHIHRHLEDVQAGKTLWVTPGNQSRRQRNDMYREHIPSVLRIDVGVDGYKRQVIEVPHRPFDEVFHDVVLDENVGVSDSAFVTGLAELQARRSESGAGLMAFLEKNVSQFENDVATEIMVLAREVTENDTSTE